MHSCWEALQDRGKVWGSSHSLPRVKCWLHHVPAVRPGKAAYCPVPLLSHPSNGPDSHFAQERWFAGDVCVKHKEPCLKPCSRCLLRV